MCVDTDVDWKFLPTLTDIQPPDADKKTDEQLENENDFDEAGLIEVDPDQSLLKMILTSLVS